MFRAPTQTPHISTLLDDMPTRDMKRIARHLGLTGPTLQRYARTGNAPRLVHLALFWETRWGHSVLDCELVNRERVQRGLIGALERENKALKAQLERLAAIGGHGAANDPLYRAGGVQTGILSALQAVSWPPSRVASGNRWVLAKSRYTPSYTWHFTPLAKV